MNRKWGWLGAFVALCAAFGSPVAPAQAAKAPHGFYGISTQTALTKPDYEALGKGRVGNLRVEIPWGDVDVLPPASDAEWFTPRPYCWSRVDPTVSAAARHGITVLPTIYGTPSWVARYQGCYFQCHKLGPTTIYADIALAQFLKAAVERYGPGGVFWARNPSLPYKPIRTWQIWNEQNSSDFWKPSPNVTDYGNLLIAAGAAVHAADPGAKVILGGMFGEPGQAEKITISGWNFLADLYAIPDAGESFDGIAVHPYGHTLKQVDSTIRRWRRQLRAAGAANEQIWVTEIGWASGGERHPLNVGLRGQADLLHQALDYFTTNRKRFNFAQVDIYSWRDAAPGADNCSWCSKSGLVRYHGREPKPAWRVYRQFTGALSRR